MPAFTDMLAAHQSRAFRLAVGYLGDEQVAREASQEALLKAFRARDRYNPALPFYPWLRRIVRNTCFDELARRKHRAVPGLQTDRLAADQASPLDRIDAHQAQARVRRAMATLQEDHREILVLRHFEDLSYAEISEILDIANGTVMSRLYRARKALAQALNLLESP